VISRDSCRVAPACHASRNEENPLLVTFDQDFKRLEIPTLRSGDEDQVTSSGRLSTKAIVACFLSMLPLNLAGTVGSFLKLINQSA
jgi:hypothetical protein